MNSFIIEATLQQLEIDSVVESKLSSVTSKYSKKQDGFWVKIVQK